MLRYCASVAFLTLSWTPVVITFNEHVAHFGRIEGISMKPTFNPDSSLGWSDFVLLWKYGIREPNHLKVGDVVLIRSPQNPEKFW